MSRKSFSKIPWFMLIALLLATGVVAQVELEESYEADIAFEYPADWELVETDEATILLADGAGLEIAFYSPELITSLAEDLETDSPLATLLVLLETIEVQATAPADFALKGRLAARTQVTIGDRTGVAYAVEFDDGTIGVLLATASDDIAEEFEDIILDIAESFDSSLVSETGKGGGLAGAIEAAAAARGTDVECSVRTNQPNYASVRVGPGNNRTAILYLPANRDFNVVGQGEANDGALWWKLDVDEVGPNSGAAELWVAQAQVSGTGDCDLIPSAAAPPIIPIVTVATDILPTPGVWFTDTAVVRVDCPGAGIVTVEMDPGLPSFVDLEDNGNVLNVDGDRFGRTQPGVYAGSIVVPIEGDIISVDFTWRVVDEDHIDGSGTGSFQGCTMNSIIPLARR